MASKSRKEGKERKEKENLICTLGGGVDVTVGEC